MNINNIVNKNTIHDQMKDFFLSRYKDICFFLLGILAPKNFTIKKRRVVSKHCIKEELPNNYFLFKLPNELKIGLEIGPPFSLFLQVIKFQIYNVVLINFCL